MIRDLFAYVDFRSTYDLKETAAILGTFFGGAGFVGENEGIWDEVPALRLERSVLGLSVVVGGADGEFTLEVEPLSSVKVDVSELGDLSEYLGQIIAEVEGFELRPTRY